MSALNIKKGSNSHSAYELRDPNGDLIESHTLAVVVANESGRAGPGDRPVFGARL